MHQYFSLLNEEKNTFDFSKGTVKVWWFYFVLIKYYYKMTQYNTLSVKLCNSQLNKLKSEIKNGTKVTLNLSLNLIGRSNGETHFPHKLLLTTTQVSKICQANGSSANIKFSKTQLSTLIQSGAIICDTPIFGNILLSVAKKGTDIARNLRKHFLAKQIDTFNQEYITGKGWEITLTNNEIKDIKVIKFLENRGILLKGTTRKITGLEGGFLNFVRSLMTAGFTLMKSLLTPQTKSGL